MLVHILEFSFSGIKNVEKKMKFNFYKKDIDNFSRENYNIKSVYGPNGVGKTAFIDALRMMKEVSLNRNYLIENRSLISELINKNTKCIELEIIFYYEKNSHKKILKHEVTIEMEKDNEFVISYEKISELTKRYEIKKNSSLLIKNGMVKEKPYKIDIDFNGNFESNSIIPMLALFKEKIFKSEVTTKEEILNQETLREYVFEMVFCYLKMTVVLNEEDNHYFYLNAKNYNIKNTSLEKEEIENLPISAHSDHIPSNPKVYKNYIENIKKMESFLKILKPSLRGIRLEKKTNKERYIIEKYFVYDKYEVHIEFESAGIKRLVNLFNALNSLKNGGIVLIDELDANIHDVFLSKMLQYFIDYPNGQLIFTSHNLAPMKLLQHQKKAIDFINFDNEVIPYVQKGNAISVNIYVEGAIKGLAFDYDNFDFIKILGE